MSNFIDFAAYDNRKKASVDLALHKSPLAIHKSKLDSVTERTLRLMDRYIEFTFTNRIVHNKNNWLDYIDLLAYASLCLEIDWAPSPDDQELCILMDEIEYAWRAK